MATWLVKSEPESWSWQKQTEVGTTCWDGVRNHQASNHLKAMAVGDRAFFYHSGKAREIVGIVEVVRPYYPDPTDESGRFGMVDVRTVTALPKPVTLKAVKAEPRLHHLDLVRQSRLSVMPIDEDAWRLLCAMGGIAPD
jgi:predicted RNA-binding protein with PUA-like domain